MGPDSIVLLADLRANQSDVNERYFNFGNNGPLNCGNLGIEELFRSRGYTVSKLGDTSLNSVIDPRLNTTMIQEGKNDGFFWVAHRGEKAEKLIAQAA